MKNWIINHLRAFTAIVVFGITFIIIGVVMIASYGSYKAYERNYYQNDLETRSVAAAAPTAIEINDNFASYNNDGSLQKSASKLKQNVTAWAEDLKVSKEVAVVSGSNRLDSYLPGLSSGGTVSVKLDLAQKAFVDIDFVVSSNYKKDNAIVTTEDLLSNVSFKVNGEVMDEVVDLESDGSEQNWHHVVMSNFALPEGQITIEITNVKNKAAYMPNIRNISIFAGEAIAFAE